MIRVVRSAVSRSPFLHQALLAGIVLLAGFFQNVVRNLDPEILGDTSIVALPPGYVGLSIDHRIIQRFMGLRVVVADLLWVDMLLKSDIVRQKEPFSPFYRAARTVLALDPDHFYGYYVAGMYLSVIKDDIKGASAILRDGALYIQDRLPAFAGNEFQTTAAWKVYFMLGYHLIFEELETVEGGKWVVKASEMENVPNYIHVLANKVSTEGGRLEVGEKVLSDLYARAQNHEDRLKIEKKMLELSARRQLIDLNERFVEFLTSTEAYAMPKEQAFRLFLRHHNHPPINLLGQPLGLNKLGKIDVISQ